MFLYILFRFCFKESENSKIKEIIKVEDINLKGEHNLENMLFVISSVIICNVDFETIKTF